MDGRHGEGAWQGGGMNPFLRCPDTISPLKPQHDTVHLSVEPVQQCSKDSCIESQCPDKCTHIQIDLCAMHKCYCTSATCCRDTIGSIEPGIPGHSSHSPHLEPQNHKILTTKNLYTRPAGSDKKTPSNMKTFFSVNFEPCIVENLNPMTFKMANIATNTHICFYWVI